MTATPEVSLIIVSRNRAAELHRLLQSLRYLRYPQFEVVVVSDIDPDDSFPDLHNVSRIRFVPFDLPNISAARNLGVAHAAGQIVAFCDDDAVPEPTWLDHLIPPFDDANVAAAGGYVRGRNGISFQWHGHQINRYGDAVELALGTDAPVILSGSADTGIKTEGTNCAFRRQVLLDIGGFDENFHYYLDETDVNFRLGNAGWKTAIVPLAQVHHGFAASPVRNRNRAPTSLFQIGASKAWYCRKHGDTRDIADELAGFRQAQRRRLIAFMLQGDIEPFAIPRLMAGLDQGIDDGMARVAIDPRLPTKAPNFCSFHQDAKTPPMAAFACRASQWPRARKLAERLTAEGICLTVFRFSATSAFHRMRFDPAGYWLQTGGIFGRSDRRSGRLRLSRLKSRVRAEIDRLHRFRPIKRVYTFKDY